MYNFLIFLIKLHQWWKTVTLKKIIMFTVWEKVLKAIMIINTIFGDITKDNWYYNYEHLT